MIDTLVSFSWGTFPTILKIRYAMGGATINKFLTLAEMRDRRILALLRYFTLEESSEKLILKTSNPRHCESLKKLIVEKLGEVSGQVMVVLEGNSANGPSPEKTERSKAPTGLNSRYSFENFVVGDANRTAYQVALDVAERPGKIYNPFFLYGQVGLGKTHLLQAIGNYCTNRGLNVMYASANDFSEEMVDALRKGKIRDFRNRYRAMDVLIIDDIQFLSGKTRTQIEFFNIFNHMYLNEKQIVLASDRHPRELRDVSDRLISRFEGGIIVEIELDRETKVEIIRQKLKELNLNLEEDSVRNLANSTKDNVREIEGLLKFIKVSGRVEVKALPSSNGQFDRIMDLVSSQFGVEKSDLIGRGGSRRVNRARHVAMYLCRRLTDASLIEIARGFGRKDHSTVIYGIKRVEKEREKDRKFKLLLDFLEEKALEKLRA